MISIKEPNKRQIEKLENRNRFQACQDQIEIITLKKGYLILNENQLWKIQVCRIITSSKEPNKRQIGKLENAFNSIENIFKKLKIVGKQLALKAYMQIKVIILSRYLSEYSSVYFIQVII